MVKCGKCGHGGVRAVVVPTEGCPERCSACVRCTAEAQAEQEHEDKEPKTTGWATTGHRTGRPTLGLISAWAAAQRSPSRFSFPTVIDHPLASRTSPTFVRFTFECQCVGLDVRSTVPEIESGGSCDEPCGWV
ncbi:hypothetical protein GCM10010421_38690 [Streptomyces glaucus]|uniref:Uncharacterized protein n=1 Tax=Streptomyces glaucus TaxID=284029 RepID=A0ABN3JY37_9ACTN